MFKTNPKPIQEPEQCVNDALTSVPMAFIGNAMESVEKRLHKCVANGGSYVEL